MRCLQIDPLELELIPILPLSTFWAALISQPSNLNLINFKLLTLEN